MTATTLRFPLSSAHNRKRCSALYPQDKPTKPKATLNFVASVEIATTAEMSVEQVNKALEAPILEDQLNSIFRQTSFGWTESRDESETEDKEIWTLKRASPILEEEDEEVFICYESPSKKAKAESVFWESRLEENETFHPTIFLEGR